MNRNAYDSRSRVYLLDIYLNANVCIVRVSSVAFDCVCFKEQMLQTCDASLNDTFSHAVCMYSLTLYNSRRGDQHKEPNTKQREIDRR